jgi:hypothetical protein
MICWAMAYIFMLCAVGFAAFGFTVILLGQYIDWFRSVLPGRINDVAIIYLCAFLTGIFCATIFHVLLKKDGITLTSIGWMRGHKNKPEGETGSNEEAM